MTAEQMWHAFCESSGVSEQTPYSAWAFCGGGAVGDELAQLVLAGTKTATASALLAFELEQEPLPKVGEYSVILLDSGEAAGVICGTKVMSSSMATITAYSGSMFTEVFSIFVLPMAQPTTIAMM